MSRIKWKPPREPSFYLRLIFLALLVLVAMSGCEEENKASISIPPPPKPPISIEFNALVEPRGEPNRYQVHLKWTTEAKPAHWNLARSNEDGVLAPLVSLEGDKHEFVDTTVTPGKTYHYTLSPDDAFGTPSERDVRVTVSEDLEVKAGATITLNHDVNVRIIYLRRGAKIYTGGSDIHFNAEAILSEDASIESFPPGQTSSQGSPGRYGGNITIRALRGVGGTLYIYARGENGGSGFAGRPGSDRTDKALSGFDGICGYHGDDMDCRNVVRDNFELWKNEAAKPGPYQDFYRDLVNRFYCKVQTRDGFAGIPGEAGGQGGTGGRGGNSGRIYVELKEVSSLEVHPYLSRGLGGAGGEGGPGGQGGRGGDPGKPDHLGLCRTTQSGPRGATGSPGASGERGSDGELQAFCIRYAKQSVGDCDLFPLSTEVRK